MVILGLCVAWLTYDLIWVHVLLTALGHIPIPHVGTVDVLMRLLTLDSRNKQELFNSRDVITFGWLNSITSPEILSREFSCVLTLF